MKIIKPFIFYILSLILYFIALFIISLGDVAKVFRLFNLTYIIYIFLFSCILYYFNRDSSKLSLLIVALFAIFTSFIFNEVIYTNILHEKVILTRSNSIQEVKSEDNLENKEISYEITNFLDKAEYYFNIKDYSSSWIYADTYLDRNGYNERAEYIREKSKENISKPQDDIVNEKYIDTLIYKKLINQNKILDAYYFCLDNRDNIFDYDFLIKYRNSYQELLNEFYSIDIVESMINLPGYTDIKFYVYDFGYELFSVDKIVEFDGYYFFHNIKYKDSEYLFLVIEPDGKVLSSGFREDRREVILKEFDLSFPVNIDDLKLFSQELYPVVNKSLFSNLKLLEYKNIKYLQYSKIYNLIIGNIVNYLGIFILLFLPGYYLGHRIFNYIFNIMVNFFISRWFINKIGLILISYSLGLSIIFVLLSFIIWIYIIFKKIKLLPSQF